ncbi:hypothetical protein [Pedobacter antarcticus]|uniref:hypothetical protein n=1 Tax=Pedobacter antarcticus TaxID=34086 RepID=UPI00088020CF|nr:hypothetical protein [Pedobacter antarcticus]SDM39835.1 hypothetical protein SAMN04488084_106147 [Pedobacter antarcticus]
MTKKISKVAAYRYYLHKRLKGKYKINSEQRAIDLPYAKFNEVPTGDRYYIGQLIKLGYNVQLKLF